MVGANRLFWRRDNLPRRCHRKQFAGTRYIGLAGGTGEQAVMAIRWNLNPAVG
jgi:hypothetical protein